VAHHREAARGSRPREPLDPGDEGPGPEHLALGEVFDQHGEVEVGPTDAAGLDQLEEAGGRALRVVEDLVEAGIVDRGLPSAAQLVENEEAENTGKTRGHLGEVRGLQDCRHPCHARRATRVAGQVEVARPADREALVLPPAQAGPA